jgi:LuxR family quorum-sensing system transcriptional regulator SolR
MANWREECLDRLTRPGRSMEQVFAELAEIVRGIGFEHCSFAVRFPNFDSPAKDAWSANSTYPMRWLDQYFSHDYLKIDPVINAALRSTVPIVWSDDLFKKQGAFWEEARAFGIQHGWTLAMHGRGSEIGLLSLARSSQALSSDELAETEAKLVWLAHMANGVVGSIVAQKHALKSMQELTARECEVLRWTAAGKTSGEIGMILGISTRTVNFHITTALMKLDAVNKTQAVVKALMLEMIN